MGCCIPQLAGDLLRTFVCVAIPDEQRQRIAEWINERKTVSNEIRWVEPITLHITLKFCGERLPETVKMLAKYMDSIISRGPFEISLEGCGGFPNLVKPKVIWTGVTGDTSRLNEIFTDVESVANRAGIPKEKKTYSPHLTLGRRSVFSPLPEQVKNDIDSHPIKLDPWAVTEIILMKSRLLPHGPEYTPIALFKI